MKSQCGIYVFFLVIVALVASQTDERKQNIIKQALLCRKEKNITDVNIALAKEATTKCYLACCMKKLEVMDKVNKLVPENLEKMVFDDENPSKDGKTLLSVVPDIAEACKMVSDPDECESAAMIFGCLVSEAMKRGFKKFL